MPATASSTRPWRLLSLPPVAPEIVQALLAELPIEVYSPEIGGPDDLRSALVDAELLLGDWRTAQPGLDASLVAAAPALAFVQQPSVGVQAHDPDALAAAGVPLANVAGFNAVSVAEWVLGAMLSLSRLLGWSQDELRAGRWPQTEVVERGAVELAGRRVALVGFGAIGSALAARLAGLGCPVSYWSRSRRPAEREFGAQYVEDLDELIVNAEILVNVLALAPGTAGLLDRSRLESLMPGAMLINASRGGIVDETATADLLNAGRLAGAAFDVFDTEPLPRDSALLQVPPERILLTPHIAGSTRQSVGRLLQAVAGNLKRATDGEPVLDVVNGVDPVVRRRA